jgi:cytochrome oxidase assembly protein ShyY1
VPAIIDSAPDCITHVSGAKPPDDSADFILQAAYQKCQGIMTFGHGTTYGDGGSKAATTYYVLTWIGIAVMVAVIVAWMLYEDRRLWDHVARIRGRERGGPAAGVTEPPVTH